MTLCSRESTHPHDRTCPAAARYQVKPTGDRGWPVGRPVCEGHLSAEVVLCSKGGTRQVIVEVLR